MEDEGEEGVVHIHAVMTRWDLRLRLHVPVGCGKCGWMNAGTVMGRGGECPRHGVVRRCRAWQDVGCQSMACSALEGVGVHEQVGRGGK